VLDRSGSMAGAKWIGAVNAITRLAAALSNDTRVGLTFFPTTRGAENDQAAYRDPSVPVQPLSQSRSEIARALSSTRPMGGTPMGCGMEGAVEYMRRRSTVGASRSIILITDGQPSGNCGNTAGTTSETRVLSAAGLGATAAPPVRTFVLGTPNARRAFLSQLAVRGGTQRAAGCDATQDCHYSLADETFERDVNAALDQVRHRTAGCQIVMPESYAFDPMDIVLTFTRAGGAGQIVRRDGNRTDGWDLLPDGRTITLFGPMCGEIRAGTATYDLAVGCTPSVADP